MSRFLGALALVASAAPLLAGCSSDCGCEERYRECIEKAPPGASRSDCANEQNQCETACDEGRSSTSSDQAHER